MKYTQTQQNFLDQVLLPALSGSKTKNISALVYDLNGKIIFATDLCEKLINYKDKGSLVGKTAADLTIYRYGNYYKELEKIRKRVIHKEKTIYYILFNYFSYGFDAHAIYQFPVFMPDGSIVATKTIGKRYDLFNPVICFNQFIRKEKKLNIDNINNINFTDLEYKIMFLLYIGLTQEEAALFLGISRGYLGKTLTKSIYSKLPVTTQDELIQLLAQSSILATIPEEFMQPKVILLDSRGNDILG